jgi:hypothetical protein
MMVAPGAGDVLANDLVAGDPGPGPRRRASLCRGDRAHGHGQPGSGATALAAVVVFGGRARRCEPASRITRRQSTIKDSLRRKMQGTNNAGDIAVIRSSSGVTNPLSIAPLENMRAAAASVRHFAPIGAKPTVDAVSPLP